MLLRLILLVLISFSVIVPAEALFRRSAPAAGAHRTNVVRNKRVFRNPTPLERSNSSTESILALVGLLAAVVCFGAFALTGMGLFLIPMFAFSVFAIVMGCFGIHRQKRGMALAGIIGGFLCLLGGFIALGVR